MKTDPFRLIGADATRTCWRVAAIYRCCLRYDASPEWAIGRMREIFPDGTRDHMVGHGNGRPQGAPQAAGSGCVGR